MYKQPRRVAVIGGGIGGLTLAHMLRVRAQRGDATTAVEVKLFERDGREAANTRARQGYLLGIDANGKKLLEGIRSSAPGLSAILDDKANVTDYFCFRAADTSLLLETPILDAKGVYADRGQLRSALLEGVDCAWGKAFSRYEERPDGSVDVHFEDGTVHNADVVIGADGANSRVRRQHTPGLVYRDLGITNVAGLAPVEALSPRLQAQAAPGLNRILGPDGHTLLLFLYRASQGAGPTQALWALSHPGARAEWEGTFTSTGDAVEDEYSDSHARRRELLAATVDRVKARFHGDYAAMIAGSDAACLYGPRQIYSVPPKDIKLQLLGGTRTPPPPLAAGAAAASAQAALDDRSIWKPAYLLGDASHATTTHRGLGANTAIADASELAAALLPTEAEVVAATAAAAAHLQKQPPKGLGAAAAAGAAGAASSAAGSAALAAAAAHAAAVSEAAAAAAAGRLHPWATTLPLYERGVVKRGTRVADESTQSTRMIHATGFFGTYVRPAGIRVAGLVLRLTALLTRRKAA